MKFKHPERERERERERVGMCNNAKGRMTIFY